MIDLRLMPLGVSSAAFPMHARVRTALNNVSIQIGWRCRASKQAVRELLLFHAKRRASLTEQVRASCCKLVEEPGRLGWESRSCCSLQLHGVVR